MEEKVSKVKKQERIKTVKKVLPVCNDCVQVMGPHVHLVGAVSLVQDNEKHEVEFMTVETYL